MRHKQCFFVVIFPRSWCAFENTLTNFLMPPTPLNAVFVSEELIEKLFLVKFNWEGIKGSFSYISVMFTLLYSVFVKEKSMYVLENARNLYKGREGVRRVLSEAVSADGTHARNRSGNRLWPRWHCVDQPWGVNQKEPSHTVHLFYFCFWWYKKVLNIIKPIMIYQRMKYFLTLNKLPKGYLT